MTKRPDVLLIVLDDLGLVDVTPDLMPRVTAWASDPAGRVRSFARTYSMPVCSQSRACLTYGRYGRHLSPPIIGGMDSTAGPEPDASLPTLAQLLRDAGGYSTALVGKWHGGPSSPCSRGFGVWMAGTRDNIEDFYAWPRVDEVPPDVQTERIETEYATAAQLAQALAWWGWNASAVVPRFLQVSFNTPHGPYHLPPADELGGFVSTAHALNRQKYEAEIRSADWAVGQLLDAAGPDTIVVLVGDNGTPNNARAPGQMANRVKATCYEGGVRVPLAIQAPLYASAPAQVSNRLVHLVDIPATLLHAAGLTVPLTMDGRSLLWGPRTQALCEAQDGASGGGDLVRCALYDDPDGLHWKLLRTNAELEELYLLTDDPGELHPLPLSASTYAAPLSILRAQLYSS